jgi:thiamine thiazole synthase
LDEFNVLTQEYEEGYWVADAVETVSTIASRTIKAGARIFNLISAVELANLHVDPLTIRGVCGWMERDVFNVGHA